MSLVEELTQKKAPIFQVNKFDKESIDKTLSDNPEGIMDLLYKMGIETRTKILKYVKGDSFNYETEIIFTGKNYQIGFRKKETKNN
jgi:hypothetical protein